MLVTLNILLILNKREIWASEGNFLMVGQRLCPIWIVLSNFTRSRRFKIYAYLEGYMRLLADFDATRIGMSELVNRSQQLPAIFLLNSPIIIARTNLFFFSKLFQFAELREIAFAIFFCWLLERCSESSIPSGACQKWIMTNDVCCHQLSPRIVLTSFPVFARDIISFYDQFAKFLHIISSLYPLLHTQHPVPWHYLANTTTKQFKSSLQQFTLSVFNVV